jgi:hypothetical protein
MSPSLEFKEIINTFIPNGDASIHNSMSYIGFCQDIEWKGYLLYWFDGRGCNMLKKCLHKTNDVREMYNFYAA